MKHEKNYVITEDDILRISQLFACMEDAIKELLRCQVYRNEKLPSPAEFMFYTESSRMLSDPSDFDCDPF